MWPTKNTCQDVCDIMWPHLNAPSGHFTRMTLAIHIRQKWMSDGRWVKPLSFKIHQIIIYWLVVWNMTFMTFHILGVIIPTDFHIFQRGRYTTNLLRMDCSLLWPLPNTRRLSVRNGSNPSAPWLFVPWARIWSCPARWVTQFLWGYIYIYIHPLIIPLDMGEPLDYMLSAKLKYQSIFRDPASERGRRIQIIIKARCSPWWRNCGRQEKLATCIQDDYSRWFNQQEHIGITPQDGIILDMTQWSSSIYPVSFKHAVPMWQGSIDVSGHRICLYRDGALVFDTGNQYSCCHVYYTQGGAPQLYISWCINTIN